MPTTVRDVFAGAGLQSAGVVRWGERVPGPGGTDTGVYVVALVDDPDSLDGVLADCPLRRSALDQLLAVCPALTVDGGAATADLLADRLSAFWFPDEIVLYIGRAGQPLRKRVRQYYTTPLGARRPHKGGWWLKTLTVLPKVSVHYAPTGAYAAAEQDVLGAFASGVTETVRAALHDTERVMPFANLEFPPGIRKRHGIRGATEGVASRHAVTGGRRD